MSSQSFWIIIAIFVGVVILAVYSALKSTRSFDRTRKQSSQALYDLQMSEIEDELASGEISATQAQAMKSEVERAFSRMNRRGEDAAITQGPVSSVWIILAVVVVASIFAYSRLGVPKLPDFPFAEQAELRRPAQDRAYEILEAEGQIAPVPPLDTEMNVLISKLEETLEKRPNEAEGWQYLARSSYSTGNFKRAYEAQQRYIDLIGNEATAENYTFLAESMILTVNGYISPEAEFALKNALRLDPNNRVGRYYAALTMIQEGERENGREILTRLLQENEDDPDWSAAIEMRLAESEPAKGPSDEDIANAADMSEEDRQAMIGSMVDGLKERLATEGGTPQEWARLITSLRTLGRNEEASAILGEAQTKFPEAPEIQNLQ